MTKTKQKSNNLSYWLSIGLIAQLLIAPNSTVMKVLVDQIDPLLFNAIRGSIAVLVSLPFVIMAISKINKTNLAYVVAAGLCMTIATIANVLALQASQASYVVVMSLLNPIILVVLSSRLMGEKVSFRSSAGITLAALGAFVAVSLPLFIGGDTSLQFYPLATVLMLFSCFFFPLGLIMFHKAHESGLSLPAVQGMSSVVIAVISFIAFYAVGGSIDGVSELSTSSWIGIVYSGVVVIFIARIMANASLERIGASAFGGLVYLENIVAVIIPVLFLSEKLSVAMILGGVLMLVGVYLTEKHRIKHHPHLFRTIAHR